MKYQHPKVKLPRKLQVLGRGGTIALVKRGPVHQLWCYYAFSPRESYNPVAYPAYLTKEAMYLCDEETHMWPAPEPCGHVYRCRFHREAEMKDIETLLGRGIHEEIGG